MELKLGKYGFKYKNRIVLIVPYGIETDEDIVDLPRHFSINCTLWN